MDKKEIFEICKSVDSAIAAELAESIMYKVSFETLESHHGILPISRRLLIMYTQHTFSVMEQLLTAMVLRSVMLLLRWTVTSRLAAVWII